MGKIVSGTTRYIKYFIAQKSHGQILSINSENRQNTPNAQAGAPVESLTAQNTSFYGQQSDLLKEQDLSIDKYLKEKTTPTEIVGTFIDNPDNRRTTKWPQLKKAIQKCLETNASLLIAELGTFTNNETFAKLILDANINFHCCDQHFIDRNNLEALYKHLQIQKKIHGNLIRQGLENSPAKSGNPNADQVIREVNKPKIRTAIIFAYLIKPIIEDYTKKGYSQRQMVKMLNDEHFTAPEGGKWVLSQLQKVLDRVKLNDITNEVGNSYKELKAKNLSHEQIAEELNKIGAPAIKKASWDAKQVDKLADRIEQLNEINLTNNFIAELINIIHDAKNKNIAPIELMRQFENNHVKIRHFDTTQI